MDEFPPLPLAVAVPALCRCIVAAASLLARRRVHAPARVRGTQVHFADGTSAAIYRETVVDRAPAREPCALVVEFRLRGVHGRGHTAFRWESALNTPLFIGFPGFVSKLWLAHDENGVYRGLYEWDGADAADHYARCLWWVLILVSERRSIHHRVLPGAHRDDLLRYPLRADEGQPPIGAGWWRPVAVS